MFSHGQSWHPISKTGGFHQILGDHSPVQMAGQPPVECETCLPMKQLRDANLVANFVKILLNIIRAAVIFWNFCCSPLPHGLGTASRHRSKETFFMMNYDLCENDVLKLAHAIHAALIFFWLVHHPWSPPTISIWTRCWCCLVKQAAAGFIMFHRFQGNFPAFLVRHWHAYPFTTWNLCLQHQEVNATPEVQALVARLNDLKSGGAAGLGP